MTTEISKEELHELQLDYLTATRETVQLMKAHGDSLSSRKRFKQAFPVLLYLSHQLKGSGGSLGFQKISDLALQMSIELNQYLEEGTTRPQPGDLSRSVKNLAEAIEAVIDEASASLERPSAEE